MGGIKFNEKSIAQKLKSAEQLGTCKSQARKAVSAKVSAGNAFIGGGGSGSSAKNPSLAAGKFISVLKDAISSSGLSNLAIEAVSNINHTEPIQIGDSTRYIITVYFSGDLGRPSLNPQKYGGIDNIVLLLNEGVGHTMESVYGYWPSQGRNTWSKTTINGAHFIQQAITDFMGNYASEYNVVDITFNT